MGPFVAFLLHRTLLPFPVHERYPGAVAFGWYQGIREDGEVDWCDGGRAAHFIRFPDKPGDAEVVQWWRELDGYVERLRRELAQPNNDAEPDAVLDGLGSGMWQETRLGQHDWKVWGRAQAG